MLFVLIACCVVIGGMTSFLGSVVAFLGKFCSCCCARYCRSSVSTSNKMPKRIYLIRHGQSQGNVEEKVYEHIPDNLIPLTPHGRTQATNAGRRLWASLKHAGLDRKVKFWISPHLRCRETTDKLLLLLPTTPLNSLDSLPSSPQNTTPLPLSRPRHQGDMGAIRPQEEPRLREQDFGHFRDEAQQKKCLEDRERFGRFYYRFPHGESGADVYDRVSTFLETLYRDLESGKFTAICLVSHGLTLRFFLMRLLRWRVETLDTMANFDNCEIAILEMNPRTKHYELLPNDEHTRSVPALDFTNDSFGAWYEKHRHGLTHS